MAPAHHLPIRPQQREGAREAAPGQIHPAHHPGDLSGFWGEPENPGGPSGGGGEEVLKIVVPCLASFWSLFQGKTNQKGANHFEKLLNIIRIGS